MAQQEGKGQEAEASEQGQVVAGLQPARGQDLAGQTQDRGKQQAGNVMDSILSGQGSAAPPQKAAVRDDAQHGHSEILEQAQDTDSEASDNESSQSTSADEQVKIHLLR